MYNKQKFLMAALASLLLLVLPWGSAQAIVTVDTVTVGNPGNDADDTAYGSVAYVYDVGKYEVTAGQYAEFLNAVATTDTYGLYHPDMWAHVAGCKIAQSGVPGSYAYTVVPEAANRPANVISWGDAARFANWMHNGQPTGGQDLSTTEDGSYYLDGANTDEALAAVTREPNATWVVPSEDEWYKAAFHQNDGVTGNYWDLPTQRDTPNPGRDMTEATNPGNNLNNYGNPYPIDDPYRTTIVGEFELSESPYGTFDQGGNVFEWNETVDEAIRGIRGGGWGSAGNYSSGDRSEFAPLTNRTDFGFRLAVVTVPWAPLGIPGDANLDEVVDAADAAVLANNWLTNVNTWLKGDFNGDGVVDEIDATLLATNWQGAGASASVPEPSSLILMLGILGLAAFYRRAR